MVTWYKFGFAVGRELDTQPLLLVSFIRTICGALKQRLY